MSDERATKRPWITTRRHGVGWCGVPTVDQRIIAPTIQPRHPLIPVLFEHPLDPLSQLRHVGYATGMAISVIDGEITVITDCEFDDDRVLSLDLDSRRSYQQGDDIMIDGEVVAFTIIDRREWAWQT